MTARKRLDQLLHDFVEAGIPGCALSVVYKGENVYTGFSGMARVEEKKVIDANTVYKLASCTKPMTAAAAMKLYEEGKFLLDDPVERYLPFFRNMTYQTFDGSGEIIRHPVTNPITIRNLLTMTSGIPYMGRGSLTAEDYMAKIGGMYNLPVMELAKKIAEIPLEFDPGTHWHYGFSYDVLAAVMEAITGKPYAEYLKEAILEPLGMEHTTFVPSEELQKEMAHLYRFADGGRVNISKPFTEQDRIVMGGGFGGGGLVSTLGDLTKFVGMLAQGGVWEETRILGRGTIDLMRRNHLSGQPLEDFRKMARQSYHWNRGYSWCLAGRTCINCEEAGSNGSVGEFGWCGATGTYLLADPEKQLAVAYTQQTAPVIGGMQDYTHPRVRNVVYSLLDAWK